MDVFFLIALVAIVIGVCQLQDRYLTHLEIMQGRVKEDGPIQESDEQ